MELSIAVAGKKKAAGTVEVSDATFARDFNEDLVHHEVEDPAIVFGVVDPSLQRGIQLGRIRRSLKQNLVQQPGALPVRLGVLQSLDQGVLVNRFVVRHCSLHVIPAGRRRGSRTLDCGGLPPHQVDRRNSNEVRQNPRRREEDLAHYPGLHDD